MELSTNHEKDSKELANQLEQWTHLKHNVQLANDMRARVEDHEGRVRSLLRNNDVSFWPSKEKLQCQSMWEYVPVHMSISNAFRHIKDWSRHHFHVSKSAYAAYLVELTSSTWYQTSFRARSKVSWVKMKIALCAVFSGHGGGKDHPWVLADSSYHPRSTGSGRWRRYSPTFDEPQCIWCN